ncbi:MAG: WecB/TagA/CpsF family glycosyltransferase [Sphingomonadaceae bacterium]
MLIDQVSDDAPVIGTQSFIDVDIAILTSDTLLRTVRHFSQLPHFSYIVTPNVDHFVSLNRKGGRAPTDAFRAAYQGAALRLCDSRVVARLARLCDIVLPVHPGSDLTATLFDRLLLDGDHVAIIGGKADTVDRLKRKYPAPRYSQHIPPMGLLTNQSAMAAAEDFVRTTGAAFTLFAIGAPQSEILAHRCAHGDGARGVGLCIGASIDFLLGDQVRAPQWMQRSGIEWAHRLASHPRRLARRYLIEGPRIFPLAIKWWYRTRHVRSVAK